MANQSTEKMAKSKSRTGGNHRTSPESSGSIPLIVPTRSTINHTSEALAKDMVNHPPHYGQHPSGVECIDIVEHFTFNVGSAIKYLWRHGLKDGAATLEDLKKAEWYVRREIERLS
jgi:hypothetical protein